MTLSNTEGLTKEYSVSFVSSSLKFEVDLDPQTVVVGYDTEYTYPNVIAAPSALQT